MAIKFPAPFLKTKERLYDINWAKTNKWDIRILESDVPAPFNEFFPAISVTEPVFSLEDHSFSIGNASLDVIEGFKQPTLKIDFLDDHNSVLEKYFEKWVNQQNLGSFKYVLPIEECLKNIQVYKYNDYGKKVSSIMYRVCPFGELNSESTSEGNFKTFSVEFIIGSMTIDD